MRIDGAIFDLDGTLLDSMFIWDTIGEEYLRSRGMEPREDLKETFKNMSIQQAARYYQTEYGLAGSEAEIIGGINRMIARYYVEEVQPKQGAARFLYDLKRRGVAMCVATATDRYLVEAALKRTGLDVYFQKIFTCTEIGHGKDEPDIFDSALALLGTKKENTWVFEDALYAIRTAKAAGFPVAAVFDRFERNPVAVRQTADLYLERYGEMRDYFD